MNSHIFVPSGSYWWPDASAEHGISNLTNPIPPDETLYISDSFDRFLDGLNGRPFVGQLAFHNCHIVSIVFGTFLVISILRGICPAAE